MKQNLIDTLKSCALAIVSFISISFGLVVESNLMGEQVDSSDLIICLVLLVLVNTFYLEKKLAENSNKYTDNNTLDNSANTTKQTKQDTLS